jgi:hypothetical protein
MARSRSFAWGGFALAHAGAEHDRGVVAHDDLAEAIHGDQPTGCAQA